MVNLDLFDTRVAPSDRMRASNRGRKSRERVADEMLRDLLHDLAPDGRCAICGKKPRRGERLEVDHVDGATWSRRGTNSTTRIVRYANEHREGVRLRAACVTCNRSRNQHALRRDGIEPVANGPERKRRKTS